MSLLILCNVAMFTFSAKKLFRMQKSMGVRRRLRRLSSGIDGAMASTTSGAASPAIDSDNKKSFMKQISNISNKVTNTMIKKKEAVYRANKERQATVGDNVQFTYCNTFSFFSFCTYLKLFAAMGLPWGIEVIAWFFNIANGIPDWAMVMLNLPNVFQVEQMYSVYHSS